MDAELAIRNTQKHQQELEQEAVNLSASTSSNTSRTAASAAAGSARMRFGIDRRFSDDLRLGGQPLQPIF